MELAVQREQLVVLRRDERVDLDQRRVRFHVHVVKALHELHRGVDLRGLQTERKCQFPRLVGLETDRRVDHDLMDRVGVLGGDFLDLHAASLRGHEDIAGLRAVQNDTQIQLAVDRRCFFNQQPPYLLAFRSGLVRNQLHAQDVACVLFGFVKRASDLDAPTLASSTCVNLRFNHHTRSAAREQTLGNFDGFVQSVGDLTLRNWHAVRAQDVLSLVLVNFHRRLCCHLAVAPILQTDRRRGQNGLHR